MSTNKTVSLICAFILSLGILGAGYSIGKGVYLVKRMSRIVTVKGLAEKDVKSDLGLWEINYREVGNDLVQLDQRLQRDQDIVLAFLKAQGFGAEEVELTQLKVEDRLANVYNQTSTPSPNDQRYVVTSGVRLRSVKVDQIQKTAQLTNKLLQQGIPLTFDVSTLSPNPSYFYTKLDEIRPQMMAEATKSARTVADQFVKDADARLGTIQRASQGVFQVMGRDTSTMSSDWNSNQNAMGSIDKKVRLVTTLDYQLK